MRRCSKCGFPLGTRPGLLEQDGVCQACINVEKKKSIDFKKRQLFLTGMINQCRQFSKSQYDCAVAVSGGKDSHMIVQRLFENHGVKNCLLISVADEFTGTQAGYHNLRNLITRYNCDHITIRCKPGDFKTETLKDFTNELHPLKWIEERIYKLPVQYAKSMGIPLVFYGENSAYEYGTSTELGMQHPLSDSDTTVLFMGAFYPYSIHDSLKCAREIGFKDLDDFHEWPRKGSIDQFTQIDSIGYIIQLWTKFVKFGFQRVSDIACRYVREGVYTRQQAIDAINEHDHICDPAAKMDFCRCIGIDSTEFDSIVDKHANTDLVEKRNGVWRLKDAAI